MDELEFLRGIEGEQRSEESIVAGAEHMLRLKRQVGMEGRDDRDLELEKKAEVLNLAKRRERKAQEKETCPNCQKEKDACLCKMASILARARGKTAGRTAPETQDLRDYLASTLVSMREKTASSIIDKLRNINPALAVTTGLGAAAGGIGTYLASRPQKDTGKSKAEEELEGQVAAQQSQPERGLLGKLHHRNTELEHGYSKAFREHPHGAAAIGTAAGALSGYGIGRLAGAVNKMRGK